MLENEHDWKLTANLPQNLNSKRQFDLFINQVNFFNQDFVPLAHEASKTLRGVIMHNENLLFGENEEFEWKLLTAQNRINEILVEHQEIHSRQIQNIDCSTGVL